MKWTIMYYIQMQNDRFGEEVSTLGHVAKSQQYFKRSNPSKVDVAQ